MELVHQRCAGIDIGKKYALVTIRIAGAGRSKVEVRTSRYSAMTPSILALREDLLGRPIRITALAPGLAGGTEFSLVRFKGDAEKAAAPYKGVEPLTAEDIADCVMFALTRPAHVNIDEIVVKALNQTSGGRILRDE